jgi:hypothetical protein
VGPDEQDVVLTLPTGPEFGDVARLAVSELARRRGFSPWEWEELETAVAHTLRLLHESIGAASPTERVRFTFGLTAEEIVVDTELTDQTGRSSMSDAAARHLHARLSVLVDHAEVDATTGRVRFRKLRA